MSNPNPADFLVDKREGQFDVDFTIRGTIRRTIKAESLEEAKTIAEAMAYDEDSDELLELDDIHDARVDHVRPMRPMYLVTRDGQAMKVSHLQEGDIPRHPDERGF